MPVHSSRLTSGCAVYAMEDKVEVEKLKPLRGQAAVLRRGEQSQPSGKRRQEEKPPPVEPVRNCHPIHHGRERRQEGKAADRQDSGSTGGFGGGLGLQCGQNVPDTKGISSTVEIIILGFRRHYKSCDYSMLGFIRIFSTVSSKKVVLNYIYLS